MTVGVEAHNLAVRYGNVVAVDGVSFDLAGGAIHGLLGRNGAGKSSLLSVIAGFRPASAGEIRVGGEPVFENPLVSRQICLIREKGDVREGERVDNVMAFAARLRPSWDATYAAALVKRFGIPLKRKVKDLSRGQRAALAVTLGLASRAPLTIFDESYLGMDAPSRYAFYDELLADYMAHPRTIIISTHLIGEVSSLFESVVILDRGKLLLQEETETLLSRAATVTGPAEAVDRFAHDLNVLNSRQLGPTKSVVIYDCLSEDQREQAHRSGLEVSPTTLQDLFIYLTESAGGERE